MDCAIIGGGPAGMNAALVLARAGRRVFLFDDNTPRNAPTRHVHGFITRDGISPELFRRQAVHDLSRYFNVAMKAERVEAVKPVRGGLQLLTDGNREYGSRKLIIATGLKERLPAVPEIEKYYGRSLFSCPYCDGWELSGQPLAVIADGADGLALTRLVSQWSRNLVWCTNGESRIGADDAYRLKQRGIGIVKSKIVKLEGEGGMMRAILFEDGTKLPRSGGFVSPYWRAGSTLAERLGCERNEQGGIRTDKLGRTSVYGVYAAGDATAASPPQAVIAAGEGVKAAMGVNADLIAEEWA